MVLSVDVLQNRDTTAQLDSSVQSFKKNLQCLGEEQEKEQGVLDEVLKLLNALVSEHSKPSPGKVMDSASQTSPCLGNKLEDTQFTSYNVERSQVEVPPQDPSRIIGKRKSTSRGTRRRYKKRPLVLSQRSKSDENSQPVMKCHKNQSVSAPWRGHHDLNRITSQENFQPDRRIPRKREARSSNAAGCFITPLSCWSQDSSSSACLAGVEPIIENLSAETPVEPESFWQLFDMNCDSDIGF